MKGRKRGLKKARVGVQTTKASAKCLPTLPLDVLHAVFQHTSKPTLLACSVVSRIWREAAVSYLFASIEIARSAGQCAEVSKELLDMCPHLTRHIRRLCLAHQKPRWSGIHWDAYPVVDRTTRIGTKLRSGIGVRIPEKAPELDSWSGRETGW
ncbi:hypothetical protein NUW54_g10563 [Trametes sanguinea]|uniref:Uncharacterized protein n=1 Tax=Trametes sanguinea TaxID=158606 RepID=A0ACC1NYF1_9APHY|nr:hypothetical protein NUW54_g10563 [Trametes sanguinea]